MTETVPANAHSGVRPYAGRAWAVLALTPVGVVAGVAVAYAVAAVIGVTLDPATGPGPNFVERLIIWSVASVVWLAAPFGAVLLARRPARVGSRSGIAALIVGSVILAAAVALSVWAIAFP